MHKSDSSLGPVGLMAVWVLLIFAFLDLALAFGLMP